MQVAEIEAAAVGRWVIVTLAGGVHILHVPEDGRATWTTTRAGHRARPGEGSTWAVRELVAWGSYDVLSGMREGIAVGESVVLVTEPLSPDGVAVAVISTPVLTITDVSGDLQLAGL